MAEDIRKGLEELKAKYKKLVDKFPHDPLFKNYYKKVSLQIERLKNELSEKFREKI